MTKKSKSYFSGNKKISKLNKELTIATQKKKLLREDVDKIIAEFLKSLPTDKQDLSQWLTKLPIDTLSDLYRYEDGEKLLSCLKLLESRSSLRKDKDQKTESVEQIISNIKILNIDIMLEKIKIIENKLDGY